MVYKMVGSKIILNDSELVFFPEDHNLDDGTLPGRTRPSLPRKPARASAVSAQPHLRRTCVGLQAFAMRQRGGDPAQGLGTGFADFDQAAALLEIVDAQRR